MHQLCLNKGHQGLECQDTQHHLIDNQSKSPDHLHCGISAAPNPMHVRNELKLNCQRVKSVQIQWVAHDLNHIRSDPAILVQRSAYWLQPMNGHLAGWCTGAGTLSSPWRFDPIIQGWMGIAVSSDGLFGIEAQPHAICLVKGCLKDGTLHSRCAAGDIHSSLHSAWQMSFTLDSV